MRRLTFMLAGALSWPATSLAEIPPPPEEPPVVIPSVPVKHTSLPLPTGPAAPAAKPSLPDLEGPVPPPLPPALESIPPLPPPRGKSPPATTLRSAPLEEEPPRPKPLTPPSATELPKPTPVTPPTHPGEPVVPDISGMPNCDQCITPVGMPNGVVAPVPPPPVCFPKDDCDTCGEGGLILWGEVLWLRPRRNGALVTQTLGTATNLSLSSSDYGTNYKMGFRAGGGFLTGDGWLMLANYTHYDHIAASQSFSGPGLFTYVGPGQSSGAQGSSLSASWDLRYQTVDIMAGSMFCPNDCFDLTVTMGARLARIEQDYRTRVSSGQSTVSEELNLKLHGAGPRAGGEARLYLLPWLALYGRSYGALILSERIDDSVRTSSTVGALSALSTARYDREEVVPVVELAIGADVSLLDGRLILGGGYEFNYWYDLGTANVGSSRSSDISLEGAYARVMLLW